MSFEEGHCKMRLTEDLYWAGFLIVSKRDIKYRINYTLFKVKLDYNQ